MLYEVHTSHSFRDAVSLTAPFFKRVWLHINIVIIHPSDPQLFSAVEDPHLSSDIVLVNALLQKFSFPTQLWIPERHSGNSYHYRVVFQLNTFNRTEDSFERLQPVEPQDSSSFVDFAISSIIFHRTNLLRL